MFATPLFKNGIVWRSLEELFEISNSIADEGLLVGGS